ncbi:MAG: hypothetical protein KJO30_15080 [Boseongicola sp.]|nr:hypothetical protein [Boseongicola sp.]
MTEDEFLALITSRRAKDVLDRLANLSSKERRAFAKPAMALFKKLDRFWINAESLPDPKVKDGEAVTIAVLATASGSELRKLSFFPRPGKVGLVEIVRALEPDWTQDVVDHFVEDRVFYVDQFRPLWEAGLCKRPESDAIILAYYSRWVGGLAKSDESRLLGGDVWRFFEVEGGGEDSLANHDKYLKRGQAGWAERLKQYADAGKLDRQRLLDASLDALQRDFGQYRAGWYSRFHVLMAPDGAEVAARADRYLRLLASSVPPTVSFSMKHIQVLDKAGAVDAAQMLTALEPALQARAKGTVSAALKLVLNAVKRQPNLRERAARMAVLALISEDSGVQGKALDAIESLGADGVRRELAEYVDLVAPSVRARIAALADVGAVALPDMVLEHEATTSRPVVPVGSEQEALALFLTVLEEPRDPFEVERTIDGVSRFGAALQADDKALSPLLKRAKQVSASPGDSQLRFVLALTGRALAERVELGTLLKKESGDRSDFRFVSELSLQEAHLARNVAVLDRVSKGLSLPLLALPSETSGLVRVADLLSRLAAFRDAGVEPDLQDLAFALMRLDPEGRDVGELPLETQADRAVAYVLGQNVKTGPSADLWGAAWCARLPREADARVAELFAKPTPDCGVPAAMELEVNREVSRDGAYSWIDVEVPAIPHNEIKSRALPAVFGISNERFNNATCCGYTFIDIAWASLTRPADPEPFFRIGLIHQDTWQKLSDNHTRAYLEPFFRPGPPVGPLGAGVLAYYMACEDKSVSSLAVEATAVLCNEGRLSVDTFVVALKKFLMSHSLPTTRWTKALKGVADMGAGAFARDVIVGVLDFAPEETPRDIGGLLEVCFELHLGEGSKLTNPAAIACLTSIPGGGKTARFSKKLLGLTQ